MKRKKRVGPQFRNVKELLASYEKAWVSAWKKIKIRYPSAKKYGRLITNELSDPQSGFLRLYNGHNQYDVIKEVYFFMDSFFTVPSDQLKILIKKGNVEAKKHIISGLVRQAKKRFKDSSPSKR